MGGRGSCYLNYYNDKNSTSADIDISDLFDNSLEDEDTKKEYNGKTQKLKNKNIHIKESTDNIPEEIFVPNIKKIDSLSRKYLETTGILEEHNQQLRIRADKMGGNVCAVFVANGTSFEGLQVVLNKGLELSTRENVEKTTKEQIDSGFWTKSDKQEYINQTVTHEFGHYVQKVLMEKELSTKEGMERFNAFKSALNNAKSHNETQRIVKAYSENYATNYIKQIQRIHRQKFGKENSADISRYGTTSNRECFAELFANLNTCKEPNNLSKCMEQFLERKGVKRDVKN